MPLTNFDTPHDIPDVVRAFPADVSDLMPPHGDIPAELDDARSPWQQVITHWMFFSLPADSQFYPVDGIDPAKALTHIHTVMQSYQPKHEHKMAGTAWLLSQWFVGIRVPREGDARGDIIAGTLPD